MNAAVWFGGSLFFTVGVAPAFFTPEMTRIVYAPFNGLVAQLVLDRFFALHYWCGGIAVVHLLAEWVYLGRPMPRFTVYLLAGILGIQLLGGLVLAPKLKTLHRVKYSHPKPEERVAAAKSFGMLHGVASVANLFVLGGLLIYSWRVINGKDGHRFVPTNKFRS